MAAGKEGGTSEAASLAALAAREPDADIAVELWDEVIRLARSSGELATPGGGVWSAARGDCLSRLGRWEDAAAAYGDATEALTTPETALTLTMAHDGRSLALGQMGDWAGAAEASRRALAAAGIAGAASGGGLDVPTGSLSAGLVGGAPTVAQRLDFNAAMIRWGGGDPAGAAAALGRLDVGPEPDAGYPQFWEARAARAAALYASNAKPAAEAEWAALCRPVRPNPPATPTNGVKAAVNRAAQMQFDGYGVLMDKRCEDFKTGTYLPCDDAGIPGAGGSSAPCSIFTPREAERRAWPPNAVEALARFLGDGPDAWRAR